MKKESWRTIAIIFMILFALETIYITWAINIGTEMIENENECGINICGEYDAYHYDSYNEICYCFEEGEVIYQVYIGGDVK